jgi:hypothetical protein
MMILNPVTGETVELKVPVQAPTARLQERADAKAARIAEKEARRAAAWTALRQAELDAGAL